MGIDRALKKYVNYEVEEQHKSKFDYHEIKENDKQNLIENEMFILNSQKIIEKNLYDISKKLYESQQILSNYHSGVFISWFTNLGLDKNYVYRLIDKYKLYIETQSKKAIDLPIRLVEEIKKINLTNSQKREIVESENPKLKFKEFIEISHCEKSEKIELLELEKQLEKYNQLIEKYNKKRQNIIKQINQLKDLN